MNRTEQIQKLKQMARDKYNEDKGVMHECTDEQGYESWIDTYGTAKKAWNVHMQVLVIQEENYGYLEF